MNIKPHSIFLASILGMFVIFLTVLATTTISAKLFQGFLPESILTTDNIAPLSAEESEIFTQGFRQFQFWAFFANSITFLGLLAGGALSSFFYSRLHARKTSLSVLEATIGGAFSASIASITGVLLAAFSAHWIFFSQLALLQNNKPIIDFFPIPFSMYGFLSFASNTVIFRTSLLVFFQGATVGSILGLVIAVFYKLFRKPGESNSNSTATA